MSDNNTIARPYAQAMFEVALSDDSLKDWSDKLNVLSLVVKDDSVKNMLGDPHVSHERLEELLVDVAELNEKQTNAVKVLVSNKRLSVMSEIAEHFEELKNSASNQLDVQVTTAYELDSSATADLQASLEKRFNAKVDMTVNVDDSLIGGVVIRTGDTVIDNSIKRQLEQLETATTLA